MYAVHRELPIPTGDPDNPVIMGNMTESGQGNWVRIGKNRFVLTVYRILIDANGNSLGANGKPFGIASSGASRR